MVMFDLVPVAYGHVYFWYKLFVSVMMPIIYIQCDINVFVICRQTNFVVLFVCVQLSLYLLVVSSTHLLLILYFQNSPKLLDVEYNVNTMLLSLGERS